MMIFSAQEERSQAYNALINKYVVQAPTHIIFDDAREYAMVRIMSSFHYEYSDFLINRDSLCE